MATEAWRSQLKSAVGAWWAAVALKEGPQGRGIESLLVEQVQNRGRGPERWGSSVGVEQLSVEQCNDSLANESGGENELIKQTEKSPITVC